MYPHLLLPSRTVTDKEHGWDLMTASPDPVPATQPISTQTKKQILKNLENDRAIHILLRPPRMSRVCLYPKHTYTYIHVHACIYIYIYTHTIHTYTDTLQTHVHNIRKQINNSNNNNKTAGDH